MSDNRFTTSTEVPLPEAPAKKPSQPERPRAPHVPTIGQFYAEARGAIDARKVHLARVGMTPEHATALKMPDLDERPVPPMVATEALPEVNHATAEYEQPKRKLVEGLDQYQG